MSNLKFAIVAGVVFLVIHLLFGAAGYYLAVADWDQFLGPMLYKCAVAPLPWKENPIKGLGLPSPLIWTFISAGVRSVAICIAVYAIGFTIRGVAGD